MLGTVSKSDEKVSELRTQFMAAALRMGSLSLPVRFQSSAVVLVLIWAAFSASAIVWAFLPSSNVAPMPAFVVNPAIPVAKRSADKQVVLEGMLGLGLFGTATDITDLNEVELMPEAVPDGIEEGARDTQLDLKLVGTLAGTEPDMGTAVIEVKGRQITFAVGDELPIAARVRLAKVLPTRVVLDNSGTYELLQLFDETSTSFGITAKSASVKVPQPAETSPRPSSATTLSVSKQGAKVAADYLEKFYEKPESVSDLLKIQPVQGSSGLLGYRITPAKNVEDFQSMGFKSNDLIVGVNGLSLLDASNGARLYGMLRDAQEITFDIERDGVPLSLAVSLRAGTAE